jgi:ketosteroid isomerase-like protein
MTDVRTIYDMEARRKQAMIDADTGVLATLFADDMLWIHGTARGDSKAGMLETIASGKTKYRSIESADESLRFYGDVALLSGVSRIQATIAGEERLLQNRYTIVWAQIGSLWQVVNWQSTTLRVAA